MLPVASALAIILAIFAAVAAPAWFARSKAGLSPPPFPMTCSGSLTLIVVPVQLLLITVAMVGFNQEWQVEEERPVGGVPLPGRGRAGRGRRSPRQPTPRQTRPASAHGVRAAAAPRAARSGAGPSSRTSLTASPTSRVTKLVRRRRGEQ